MMKVAVIGSGISGLAISQLLQQQGCEVQVFEKQNKPGGLIKCSVENGILFHRVGGHVFNAKNKQVLDWFWKFFDRDTEFILARRNAKILLDGKLIGYPIENYLYTQPAELVEKVVQELLQLQTEGRKDPFSYLDFEAFLKGNFGKTLYNLYFKPYNQKIWNTDLSTVSMPWLEGKLPMPDIGDILYQNIIRREEENMVHASFYYPVKGGSQFIVDRLSTGLQIEAGTAITHWEMDAAGKYSILGHHGFDRIVYCGDVRHLPAGILASMGEAGIDPGYLRQLRSNGTSNLLCECDATDLSWLYLPEDFTRAHRIIYTGNFSSTNNRNNGRHSCVVEFSGEVGLDQMSNEITKLPGNLSAVSYNHEPNSYVIQDDKTRPFIQQMKAFLQPKNVFLLGRFAEWEYYNMDKCIEAAFQLSTQMLHGS